jgi:hypothetical protein
LRVGGNFQHEFIIQTVNADPICIFIDSVITDVRAILKLTAKKQAVEV